MTCDVCHKNEGIGVAAIPGVPMSVAYCRECLEANAHPWWALVANTAMCGGYDQTNDAWKQMVDNTITHLGKTREQFDADVAMNIDMLSKGEGV